MIDWRVAAAEHAARDYPREACGLVVVVKGRTRYWPCRNVGEGNDRFMICRDDQAAAEDAGEVVGVFHSHPDASPEPSEADLIGCEVSGLEWHILAHPVGLWRSFVPSGYRAPLVGREFVHGVVDCFTLVRDWFASERGVMLPDFDRADEWWVRGQNLYLENFAAVGFRSVPLEDLSQGDALLMQIESPVPNHAAIYLGGGIILHHLYGRLSSRDVFGGYYQHVTTHCLRHAP